VENHLNDEREEYLQQTLTKLNTLEQDYHKSQELISVQKSRITDLEESLASLPTPEPNIDQSAVVEPLQQKLKELEEQFEILNKTSESEMYESSEKILQLQAMEEEHRRQEDNLSMQLDKAYELLDLKNSHIEELERELENFSRANMSKSREIELLERSSIEYSKELSKIETLESHHAATVAQLQARIDSLLTQNHNQITEVYELKTKMKYYEEEIVRCERQLVKKKEEEDLMNQRMTKLMAQVETMLSDEASETSKTIKSYQAKMEEMKQSLG
jgi:chromosome segregation ATPase